MYVLFFVKVLSIKKIYIFPRFFNLSKFWKPLLSLNSRQMVNLSIMLFFILQPMAD